MTIMKSCCCWRSVRRGSFACAVYSIFHYSLAAVTFGLVLEDESQYLSGNRTRPKSDSILESGTISPATVKFNIALLVCSCGGLICCALLLYGLLKNEKIFLIPWIFIVVLYSIVDIFHLLYLFLFVTLALNPVQAMLITLDFFLLCVNIYAALCVFSQYQEYVAGRGTSSNDYDKTPAILYISQPMKSVTCPGAKQAMTKNNEAVIIATPTSSTPSQTTFLPSSIRTENNRPIQDKSKTCKHVTFPDETPSLSLLESSEEAVVSTKE